jgi:hypothetical protein
MDQLTHDIRRANWQNIITQCRERPSNISVRQWLADNGIKEKAYYYWLRKFRKEAYEQMKVRDVVQTTDVSFAEVPMPVPAEGSCTVARSLVPNAPAAAIKYKGITIEISNDISEYLLNRILQEVTHA